MAYTKKEFIFHKELAEMGPVRIKVDKKPRTVKSKNGPAQVVDITLVKSGEERSYWCANEKCEEVLAERVGETFTVVASGGRDEEVLTYVGESGESAAPPAKAGQQRQTAPPAKGDGSEAANVANVKIYVARRLSLMKVTMKAALGLAKDVGLDPLTTGKDFVQSWNASLFIAADRAGMADRMPVALDYETLAPVHKGKSAAPGHPPPKTVVCGGCGDRFPRVDANGLCQSCAEAKAEAEAAAGAADDVPF